LLVPDEGAEQTFTVSENGVPRSQAWRFPSRTECLTCHTAAGGHALSFNTRQLNRVHGFPGGSARIIEALATAGYLSGAPSASIDLPALAAANDLTRTIEARARSHLDANCVQCHQPGGTALGNWDARSSIPITLAGIINGPLASGNPNSAARVLVPGNPARSELLNRIAHRGAGQMPPVGSTERDLAGEASLREWIETLARPGPVPQPPSRIVNLAARAQAGRDANALITGFVIAGDLDKTVLIRGVGPALGVEPFNISGSLADPILTLFGPNSSTRIAAVNDNWLAADAATFNAVGAFSLPPNSRDAAIVARLAPGSYTAQLAGSAATSGVALVEVYDADTVATPVRARLVNTSVRAHVGTGANILIPGIVVSPGASKTVLIRAVGPRLGATPFDVEGVLAEPLITLFLGAQRVAANTAWNSAVNAAEIREVTGRVGAFPLPENSRDSALLVTLPAGAYTIQVAGANGATGVALVEIYEVL